MAWFLALLIVLVIGGVAVVLSGRLGDAAYMADEYDDRPDVRVQADGPLTAGDLRAVRFTTVVRGYRASEVDALLDRLAAQLDRGRDGVEPPPRAIRSDPAPDEAPHQGLPDWTPPARQQPRPPTDGS